MKALLLILLPLTLAVTLATAQAAPLSAAPDDAQALLSRLQHAARQRNYVGTMVFTAGEVVSSSRVAH